MPNLNYDVPQDFEGNETMSESMSESMSELERIRMQIILHYFDTNKEIIEAMEFAGMERRIFHSL